MQAAALEMQHCRLQQQESWQLHLKDAQAGFALEVGGRAIGFGLQVHAPHIFVHLRTHPRSKRACDIDDEAHE